MKEQTFSKSAKKPLTDKFGNFKRNFDRNWAGWIYIMPAVLGIILFTLIPMVTSLVYSFSEYKTTDATLGSFSFVNYLRPFKDQWKDFSNSLWITIRYTVINVPLTMFLSFALAMLLNRKLPGIKVFRVLFYTPVLIPAVVGGLLWSNITDPVSGLLNVILGKLGLEPYAFYSDPETVFPTLIFMGFFNLGGGMILWLAQMKNVPETMYEAAKIEGAGFWTNTFKITVPMCTPMIFYNLIINIIGTLQTFAGVYLLINGANGEQLNFYVVYVYNTAFNMLDLGYACALSWILFVIIGILTAVVFKTSKWVFYGEDM